MYDMLPREGPEMTVERLTLLLGNYGVPYEAWGGNGTKTVQDLLDEVTSGEVTLTQDEQGLSRAVTTLGLDVFVVIDGVRYKLTEARQEFADGTVKRRTLSTSLGEKMKDGEDAADVVARALKEELGIDIAEAIAWGVGEKEVHPWSSSSYPGLQTSIVLTRAAVELSSGQFKPEGYVEEQPGRKRTYFEWEILG